MLAFVRCITVYEVYKIAVINRMFIKQLCSAISGIMAASYFSVACFVADAVNPIQPLKRLNSKIVNV